MKKRDGIEILGGSTRTAASAIGVSPQAVSDWPEVLPPRIADRVLAAWARLNVPQLPAVFNDAARKQEADRDFA